jgi:hypothetical protein
VAPRASTLGEARDSGGPNAVAISTERMTVREMKCFLCGQLLGEILVSAQQRVFRPVPGCPPPTESRLERVRCPRCSGPVYLEGAETATEWSLHVGRAATAQRHN